jgi:hypothetical protein
MHEGISTIQSTTQTTTITATWTKSISSVLANQKIQFYTGPACDTTSGDLIDLNSATAQSQSLMATVGNTYTIKITSLDAKENSLESKCSRAMEIRVADTTAPTITGVTSSTSNGSYKAGQAISIQVTFSESVTVTGTPQLTLETDTTDDVVNYTSGSGTNSLTFTYTITAGHTSADLDYQSTTALALNGGTIGNATGVLVSLTLPAPGASGSLGGSKAIVIDAVGPPLTFSAVSAGNPGSTLTPTLLGTSSEPSTVTLYLDNLCTSTAGSAATTNTAFASPGYNT